MIFGKQHATIFPPAARPNNESAALGDRPSAELWRIRRFVVVALAAWTHRSWNADGEQAVISMGKKCDEQLIRITGDRNSSVALRAFWPT
jgi:peptidoglycan/xylan/chitin deacetylase (PgdA/CDA1 family)